MREICFCKKCNFTNDFYKLEAWVFVCWNRLMLLKHLNIDFDALIPISLFWQNDILYLYLFTYLFLNLDTFMEKIPYCRLFGQ